MLLQLHPTSFVMWYFYYESIQSIFHYLFFNLRVIQKYFLISVFIFFPRSFLLFQISSLIIEYPYDANFLTFVEKFVLWPSRQTNFLKCTVLLFVGKKYILQLLCTVFTIQCIHQIKLHIYSNLTDFFCLINLSFIKGNLHDYVFSYLSKNQYLNFF